MVLYDLTLWHAESPGLRTCSYFSHFRSRPPGWLTAPNSSQSAKSLELNGTSHPESIGGQNSHPAMTLSEKARCINLPTNCFSARTRCCAEHGSPLRVERKSPLGIHHFGRTVELRQPPCLDIRTLSRIPGRSRHKPRWHRICIVSCKYPSDSVVVLVRTAL